MLLMLFWAVDKDQQMSTIVAIAAGLIIGRTCSQLLTAWTRRHEQEAVEEEFASIESEGRKRELLIRYPQYLIPPVNYRYYRAAQQELEKTQPGVRVRRKILNWLGGAFATAILVACLLFFLGLAAYALLKVASYFRPDRFGWLP